jgi:methionyl-tRNA formyltransferase
LNIVFAGTPIFALPCLDALATSTHELRAIYTQPDRPAGRGHKLQPSAVKQWALTHQVPVHQPLNFKTPESIRELSLLEPDLLIVIAYGLILPRAVLDIPRFGCINVHASLLPRWRGASPIQQAILHGDVETGITIMQMDSGLDTGAMLARVSCPIEPHATAGHLHDQLSMLASTPLLNTPDAICSGTLVATAQTDELATYAPKINKEDAAIDWQLPAIVIDRQIRAYNPWPIAYTRMHQDTLRIHQARVILEHSAQVPGTLLAITKHGLQIATGEGILLIERLQYAGGKVISVADYLNARPNQLQLAMVFA